MKHRCKSICIALFVFLTSTNISVANPRIDIARTKLKAKEALLFCRHMGFDIRYCILVDMSLPSGVKRFVIWDFRKNDTLMSALVSHGCGEMPWSGIWSKNKPAFSNMINSHCTSPGKYRVDNRAPSAWGIGIKYFLTGLEKTNSNAFKRDIVFHSWKQVPDKEVYPNGTPEDWGCPAVSNKTMKIADALIRRQKRHLLLWIYN